MDPLKKRKIDGNGVIGADSDAFASLALTLDDARKILEPFTHDMLLEIVQKALFRHPDVLEAVRLVADRDPSKRKLFIRGLGWETTTEKLRALFSSYGEIDEAVVILDKVTGKSKGYGFVNFKHVDGAMMALKEPSKKIDGRMAVTQLASAGNLGTSAPVVVGSVGGLSSPVDTSKRKIYVGNVPHDMLSERLLQHFSMYGEVEEGPLGYDKATGKSRGYALFVYKTVEAARASLVDPIKNVDGHQLNCKLADGKKGKPPGVGPMGPVGMQTGIQGNGNGIDSFVLGGQYSGPGGISGQYGGFAPGLGVGVGSGVGGSGASTIGNQPAGSKLGVNGGSGLGSTVGGPYTASTHFGGPIGTGYGGLEGSGGTVAPLGGVGSGFGAVARGGVGGGFVGPGGGGGGGAVGGAIGGAGRVASLYGLPPSSTGVGSGDYLQSAHYSLSSSGYQGHHNQPTGASTGPRVLPGAFQGMHPHPYY